MIALRRRKQGWPPEEEKSLDSRCALVLSMSEQDGAVYITKPFYLFSAVLEVTVFTLAGGGSSKTDVWLGRSIRRIGIYPRLFHWMNVRTCIGCKILFPHVHLTGFRRNVANAKCKEKVTATSCITMQ